MSLPIQPTSSPQPMPVKNSAHLLAPTFSQTMTSPCEKGDIESWKLPLWLFCGCEKLLLPSYDMRTEVKRCRQGRNFAVFVLNATPRKKFVPTFGQKPQTFPPWGGRRPLLKSQQRANSELSSTRAKTVNRGNTPQRASNENNWNTTLRSTHIRNT